MLKKYVSIILAIMMLATCSFTINAQAATCSRCGGTGGIGVCPSCGGLRYTQQSIPQTNPVTGMVEMHTMQLPCSTCGGSGTMLCPSCGGTGIVGGSSSDNGSAGGNTSSGDSSTVVKFNGAYEYTTGVVSNEDGPCLFDGDINTKYNIYASSGYICWEEANPIKVKSYTLTTGNDTSLYTGRNPKTWKLYASNKKLESDSKDWTLIHEVKNDKTLKAVDKKGFTFKLDKTTKAYKFFKFEIIDNKGDTCTQLTELKLNGKKITSPKTAITSVSRKGTKAVVKWKKAKGVKGYEVQYSTSKKFKGAKTVIINKAKTRKKKVNNLKKGKKYYFRVRTFKVVNGIKVYSKWSKKVVK